MPELSSASREAATLLTSPGGGAGLKWEADRLVSEQGERYALEGPIVRMLSEIDPLLARELEAQRSGVDAYVDPDLLCPHYERQFVARLAAEGLLSNAQVAEGGVRLDVGCGVGVLGQLFPEGGWIGLDASIDLLRKIESGYRLLVEGTVEKLPFATSSVDMVVALNMLHHVIHPDRAVQEFARVLKPGGVLVSVDPRKTTVIELVKRFLRSNDPMFAETHKAFGVDEYRTLLSAGGALRVETFKRVGFFGLIAMGGLDAVGISRKLPTERVVNALRAIDESLFRVPNVERAGLNLAVRAVRI
jgi:SAM-dependent methyltransferase